MLFALLGDSWQSCPTLASVPTQAASTLSLRGQVWPWASRLQGRTPKQLCAAAREARLLPAGHGPGSSPVASPGHQVPTPGPCCGARLPIGFLGGPLALRAGGGTGGKKGA